jgi:hypothetical protein
VSLDIPAMLGKSAFPFAAVRAVGALELRLLAALICTVLVHVIDTRVLFRAARTLEGLRDHFAAAVIKLPFSRLRVCKRGRGS